MQMGVKFVCALAAVGLAWGMSMPAYGDPLTVKTAQGKAQGKTINDGKVKAFLGLPYAAPPVGEMRWKAPAPPAKWKGTRAATKFGARCAQGRIFEDMVFQDAGPSEDCLFLNVYAPADATDKSKLPVMFWIHGGGYAGGASSEPRHNGDFLPLKGVVLVTMNYRLGVFGFLATSDLAKETGGTAGNYGLLDMVAALGWVKGNIGKFGGDAGNVTIFGESAGSFAVSALLAAPQARGLFQKAIGESGAFFGNTLSMSALGERAKRDQAWTDALGAKSLAELRALPADKVIEAARKQPMVGFSPLVDGQFLTEPVSVTYAAGRQAKVPVIIGWNRDERTGTLSKDMTAEKWKAYAAQHYGEKAPQFLAAFPASSDAEAVRSADALTTEQFIALGAWQWVQAQTATDAAPVYRYRFDLGSPASEVHPVAGYAFHSDELEYVFGTLDTRHGATWRPEDRRLSEQMIGYWTNFARSGDPNGGGLPHWPRYDRNKELNHLDNPITVGPDASRAQFEFLVMQSH